ncbi:acyltransferase family protein [Micromonospora sp. NPDC048868]|uniref:acyltransferase family protein n=1 Tax=Micromonospora sp. NPDC048868 TaxID=3364258 RepID=UPI003723BE78
MTTIARSAERRTGFPQQQGGNCFDLLRLLAALAVVVQHAVEHTGNSFLWYEPGSARWFGDGVAVFFIISGGLVFSSAFRCQQSGRGWTEYFRNRLLRVAPAIHVYLLVATAALLLIGVIGVRSLADTRFAGWFGSTLLLVPVYHPSLFSDFGTGVINGSLWTIPAEIGFYIIVPVLVMVTVRRSFRAMMCSAALVAVTGCGLYAWSLSLAGEHRVAQLLGVSTLPWLGYFLLGVMWSRLWQRAPRSGVVALAALCGYLALTGAQHLTGPSGRVVLGMLAGFPLSYLVFWLAYRGPAALHGLTARIGDLSFGAYIWHMPLVNFFIWLGRDHWPVRGTALVVLMLALTLACAAASWHLVEKPALRLKRYSARAA